MKEYKLNVDPRILELLGPNLYTNIYYVLAELIANSYDADAHNVFVFAEDEEIRVEDDGHGMSYEAGDIANYLNVAGVSRSSEKSANSKSGSRPKMGRKGVGKLAALSVSEKVSVLTIANGEKSGFILSRRPDNGNILEGIPDEKIIFRRVKNSGSAIIMRNPQYQLHKTLSSIKKNLLKIFPLVDKDFRIHIIRGNQSIIIEDFDQSIMGELSTLITLGDQFSPLCDLISNTFPEERNRLVESRDKYTRPINLVASDGVEREYILEVEGWIGTYKSTRGRKAEMTDFPDNFISIFANKKMGEFNILPVVGQNKLSEVYVVGQLHVDIFELTELPDMALSNRQGYKSDDPRYQIFREYVRKDLLAEILKRRDTYADLANRKKKKNKEEEQSAAEKKLREEVDNYQKKSSEQAADSLISLGSSLSHEQIKNAIEKSMNENSLDIGLKIKIDSQKKKILISQTALDKAFADIIYQMLLFNSVPAIDILYSSSDNQECRVPEGQNVYDYLRKFFVDSYSTKKIFVIFVTSENTRASWGAITEVGASWITQVEHKIFNIPPFKPDHPLNNEHQWQNTNREEPTRGELWMNTMNADLFCQKIEDICNNLGYAIKPRKDNTNYLKTLVSVRNN